MNFKDIELCKRHHSGKTTYCRFPLYEMFSIGEYIETDGRLVFAKAEGVEGKWGNVCPFPIYLLIDIAVLFRVIKMF